jgi:hypothetical protein
VGAEVEISPARLAVDPGGRAETQITVRNTGSVVDSFALEVLGDAAAWCVCEPATLSIFPGQQAVARLVATPPGASEHPPGPVPFAVRATSSEDPAGSVVEEGVLEVGAVALVHAELSPRTSRARGKRAGRHQVAVDNRGNTPVLVQLRGLDDEDQVRVVCDPPELDVAAGAAAFAKVKVRAEHRFWRGPAQTRRFHVIAQTYDDDEPTRMDASLLQEAAIPGWLPKAMMLLALVAVALAALWLTLLQPAVKDAATSAGTTAAQQALNSALQSANAAARNGPGGSGAGSSASSSASPNGSASPSASPSGSPAVTLPAPVSFVSDLSSGGSVSAASTQQLTVTDLVLQNPQADTGVLTITDGGTVIMRTQLADFRNYDLHFITPITVDSGKSLSMNVQCQDPAGTTCSAAALVSGMQYTTS